MVKVSAVEVTKRIRGVRVPRNIVSKVVAEHYQVLPGWFAVSHAAELLGVARQSLHETMQTGSLKGKVFRIEPQDLLVISAEAVFDMMKAKHLEIPEELLEYHANGYAPKVMCVLCLRNEVSVEDPICFQCKLDAS